MPEDKPLLLTERAIKASRKSHDKSDALVNLKLALVLTDRALYAEAVSLFVPIYETIEAILEEKKDHPQFKKIYPLLKDLRRSGRFQKDVDFLLPNDADRTALEHRRKPTHKTYSPPELQDYVAHLRSLADKDSMAFLAYVQMMFMAVFAGGFMIKRMVRTAFSLSKTNDNGVNGFCVDEGVEVFRLRKEFKRIINEELTLTAEEQDLVVAEATQVFERNNRLVATIQGSSVFAKTQLNCLLMSSGVFLTVLAIGIAAIQFK